MFVKCNVSCYVVVVVTIVVNVVAVYAFGGLMFFLKFRFLIFICTYSYHPLRLIGEVA